MAKEGLDGRGTAKDEYIIEMFKSLGATEETIKQVEADLLVFDKTEEEKL